MGFFSTVGVRLTERKRLAAAVLGGLCVAVAAFFAGTWAGSSGTFTLTANPAPVSAPGAPAASGAGGSMDGKMCCEGMQGMQGMMKDMMKDMPNMPADMPMQPGAAPTMPAR